MIPSYKSIIKGAGIFGAAKAVNILTALVRSKCAALLLGPVGVGLNSLFYTIQLFTCQLLGLGLATSSVKTLSEAYASSDLSYVDSHIRRVRGWELFCGLASMLLMVLLSPLLSMLYFNHLGYMLHFMLLGLGVAALIIAEIEQSVMRSLQASSRLAFSMLLISISALVFAVPFYWLLGARGVVLAVVSCSVMASVICLWQGHHVHPIHIDWREMIQWRVFWEASQPMLRMGFAFVTTGLFLQGSEFILQSVLATTASLTVVGLFKAGYQCSYTYPSMIFSGVVNDYFPRLSAVPEGDAEARRIVVTRQIRVMFLLSLPVAIGICLLAPWVIRLLLSDEFLSIVPMVRWSVWAILCQSICLPLGYIPLALNRRSHFMFLQGIGCFLRLCLVMCGYWWGALEGIGQGILLCALIELLLNILFCRKFYGLSIL